MEAIAIPMPLWWRLLGRLYAFALRLLPQEKQQTKADDRAGQMAADALDTYGNAILRCAYSYLHNMADAEEVLQDTLLKLLTAAPNFESEEHKKAWLLRVAANLSKNRIEYNALRTSDELSDELAEEGREDPVLRLGRGEGIAGAVPGGDPPALLRGLFHGGNRKDSGAESVHCPFRPSPGQGKAENHFAGGL